MRELLERHQATVAEAPASVAVLLSLAAGLTICNAVLTEDRGLAGPAFLVVAALVVLAAVAVKLSFGAPRVKAVLVAVGVVAVLPAAEIVALVAAGGSWWPGVAAALIPLAGVGVLTAAGAASERPPVAAPRRS